MQSQYKYWAPGSLKHLSKALGGIILAIALAPALSAQSDGSTSSSPDKTAQLLQRLEAAEAKIQQLEAQMSGQKQPASSSSSTDVPAAPAATASSTPAAAPVGTATPEAPPAAAAAPTPAPEESHDHMMEIPGGPSLHFRGFFDFNFDNGAVSQQLVYPLEVPAHSSFRAGEFDLFMTSQLSENLSFISELVLSSDFTNTYALDLERFQLTYRPSKYFEIGGGRYHTDIGYYNTTFHHGNWFSTATGRPYMYYFEDSGGILPVHEMGLTSTGVIPSGKLNLRWTAEIGNGTAEIGTSNFGDGVQTFVSNRNRKDVNFAIASKPEWLPGVQIGGSYLRGDLIAVSVLPKVNQQISSAYIVFNNARWESLNEFALMNHQIADGGRSFNSPMGYTQLAYRIGRYRPYFRFQDVNIPNNDPIAGFKGRYEGPSAGVRMDFFEYAALKFQYNRVYTRDTAPQNGFEAQMAFTF